jgi:antitoxin (DNA-binding transcriptional repressor) of toxin-antitoxin stability system
MSISKTRRALAKIVGQVADGEEFTVTKHGHPVATITQRLYFTAMPTFTISDAVLDWSKIINQIVRGGGQVTLTRYGRPVAVIARPGAARPRPRNARKLTETEIMTFADRLHEALCDSAGDPRGCVRYQPGSPHFLYYADHARTLAYELEPVIGAANVEPVVLTVIGEIL